MLQAEQRGIGYAIVKKYLENGASVVLFGSREETVEKALHSLRAENPDWKVDGAWPDLSDAKAVADAVEKVKKKYGRIDILANNAGISQSTKLEDYNPEDFDKIMDLNVKALFYTIQPTVKYMREQGGGCIINTSSMVSICGQKSGVGYPTSKSAVNGLTWSLASRAWTKQHPGKRSSSGNYKNRYGSSASRADDTAVNCQYSVAQSGRAGRHCKCIFILGKRHGVLRNRRNLVC